MQLSMWRGLAIAAVCAGLLALPAWGQRRGGGFAGHPSSGSRGPVAGSGFHGGFVGGGFRGGSPLRPGFRPGNFAPRPPFALNRFGRNRFFFGASNWYYPYFSPYYVDQGFDIGSYDQEYSAPPAYVDNSAQIQQNQIQQDQINRLEDEVDRLREERESRSQPPAKPQAQIATVLIFQDKHSEEVKNYAIVGQTLWIFSEVRARKIPLSDLNIPATQNANADHGVDFQLP